VAEWTTKVDEPFRTDARFWQAVGLSVDALLAMLAAGVLVALLGPLATVAFVLPAVLLLLAARAGRASSAMTRAAFDGRIAWRDAERRAVAAALPGAVIRRRVHRRGE